MALKLARRNWNVIIIMLLVISIGFYGLYSVINTNQQQNNMNTAMAMYIGYKHPVQVVLTDYTDSGQVVILDGTTAINWTHSLNTTDLAVSATPLQDITSAGTVNNSWYCEIVNASTIEVNVAVAPSGANWTFCVEATIVGYSAS